MQTLKMLTAAITFASLGATGAVMAGDSASAGTAGGQTTSTTQSTGQGSASDTTGSMGASGNQNAQPGQSKATTPEEPTHARDTHKSAYKKTYPNEKPIGGGELGPDERNELGPDEKRENDTTVQDRQKQQ